MDLYIVRHAIAEERDPTRWADDSRRPLTAKGRKRFARFLERSRLLPKRVDTLATSPYVRAQETADILVQTLGWATPIKWRELEPTASPLRTLDRLATQVGESVAVVGHEPHVGRLLGVTTTGAEEKLHVRFKKGGIAHIEIDDPRRPPGRLRWLIVPD